MLDGSISTVLSLPRKYGGVCVTKGENEGKKLKSRLNWFKTCYKIA